MQNNKGMQVLFLGGTNRTGPYAVRHLHALGHDVTVFHRGDHEAELPAGVRHIHGDLANPPAQLMELRPDIVVHMWAMTETDALAFLELLGRRAARAVVISSCDVYRAHGKLQRLESGPPEAIPIAEDGRLRESRYPYADRIKDPGQEWMRRYDKILVEQKLRAQTELPVTILRYPAVYGPNDPYRRIETWVEQMKQAREIRIQEDYAQWRWTHGHVEDVGEALALAITNDRAAGRVYNVGESETPTVFERMREIGRAIGWDGAILTVPAEEMPEDQRLPYDFEHQLVIDSSRIRRELGWTDRPRTHRDKA
jgi:nucleoside-diphosphate-sugar epimerase